MTTVVVLYALLLGALIAPGALLMEWAARRAAMPRRWVWAGALALLVGLTVSAPWRAARIANAGGEFVLPEATASAAPALMATADRGTLATVVHMITHGPSELLASAGRLVPAEVDLVVRTVWAASALAALLVAMLTLRRLDRQRRRWPRATVLEQSVRVAPHEGPAVYGVIHPDIVLPTALLSRTDEERRVVLLHEDEHRRAHDPLLLALSAFAVALLPWHPVAWWCAARLRLAVELDCDARVLRRGAQVRQYGEVLLSIASTMSSRRGLLPALALLDSRSHLERRLLAMTSRPFRRTPLHLALFLVFGASLTALACSTDMPTAAQIEEADVASVTSKLALPVMGDNVLYFVNGEQVSAAKANAMSSGDIATIEVRGKQGSTSGGVYIVTKDAAVGSERAGKVQWVAEMKARGDSVHLLEADSTKRVAFTVRRSAGDSVSVVEGVRLRAGNGTDALAQQPLFIIDGVIQKGGKETLSKIDPNSIKSIEVIKGAAGLAAYGERGANGVIVITRKQ